MNEIFSVLLAALALAMFAWHAPSMAAGIMSGAPSLTASTAMHTALAAGATVAIAGVGTVATVRAATAAGQGLANIGGAFMQAYTTEGGWAGVRRLAHEINVDTIATVSRGFRTARDQGRVYAITTLNPPAAGLGTRGFRAGSARTAGGGITAARLAQRIVPPSSTPLGGINAPLSRP